MSLLEKSAFKARNFWCSLGFACSGLAHVLGRERNFRTHVVLAGMVILTGWMLGVSRTEWVLLALCMTLMMAVEILNTAIEYLVDLFAQDQRLETARIIKDVSAGACLVTALGVAIAGALIFIPHLLKWIKIG